MSDIFILTEETIREKYENLSCCLNEKSRRIWAAAEAVTLGWGGMTVVSKAAGIDLKTVRKGVSEIQNNIQRIAYMQKVM